MASGTLSRAIAPLVDFVYPPRCPLCGQGIAAGPGLCVDCWAELEMPGDPACARCQIPLSSAGDAEVCGACLAHPPLHAGIAAATLYNGGARQLVLRLKHGGRIGLAELMGQLIAARLADAPAEAVLVPVPLHRTRLWMRGFNQAALLAHAIARRTGHTVIVDALRRRRPTPSLGGLGRAERARVMRGTIAPARRHSGSIEGRDVILVDDVLTSGATSSECVRVLRKSGARSVRIACFARVPDPASEAGIENETPGTARIPGAA
ncbi:MAG: amidophosphoribosyltransferase [Citromicrobium sp.]|nr:amidophosphoribosyltransferase [Citromicrobium sp.]